MHDGVAAQAPGTGRPSLDGMECLVLGGGGFIGTHLCRALARRGARVLGYGRRQSYPGALEGVRWMTGEFTDRAALARAMEGAEVVFHLLGGSTPDSSNRDPLGDLIGSVVPTLRVLELCRTGQVCKLVFVSSGGTVYGVPAQVPILEDAPTAPISAYGIGKLTIEKYLHFYRHQHGLDYAAMRVANPFGPYQDPARRQGVVAALLRAALAGRPAEIWGDGRVVRDFIYVEDVVDALIAVLGYAGPHRVFNVGSGIGRSMIEVADSIGAVLGFDEIRKVHKPGRAADVPVNVLDITRIQRELGWTPRTDWEEALRRTADWVRRAEG